MNSFVPEVTLPKVELHPNSLYIWEMQWPQKSIWILELHLKMYEGFYQVAFVSFKHFCFTEECESYSFVTT